MPAEMKPGQSLSSGNRTSDTQSVERDKALNLVLGQIERNFGKGSIMRLGDASKMRVETISTGALTLDLALGGGYPKGRVVEVYGPSMQSMLLIQFTLLPWELTLKIFSSRNQTQEKWLWRLSTN